MHEFNPTVSQNMLRKWQQAAGEFQWKKEKFSKDQCCESTNREHTVLGKEEPEETAKHWGHVQ